MVLTLTLVEVFRGRHFPLIWVEFVPKNVDRFLLSYGRDRCTQLLPHLRNKGKKK